MTKHYGSITGSKRSILTTNCTYDFFPHSTPIHVTQIMNFIQDNDIYVKKSVPRRSHSHTASICLNEIPSLIPRIHSDVEIRSWNHECVKRYCARYKMYLWYNMLRKISVVITNTWASLFTAESPVRRPTLSSPKVSLKLQERIS